MPSAADDVSTDPISQLFYSLRQLDRIESLSEQISFLEERLETYGRKQPEFHFRAVCAESDPFTQHPKIINSCMEITVLGSGEDTYYLSSFSCHCCSGP
ncbi:hypothetical protein KIL84_022078 [Mauremys mutica]|uniref:Uncharacterized protein n=1 Tax=Mauremys mutica TaxID=74926 RepID=A0A9D3XI60_9SAUR|nr:hypothetical protein KIL84_022078 [Mauremys mutica]